MSCERCESVDELACDQMMEIKRLKALVGELGDALREISGSTIGKKSVVDAALAKLPKEGATL